MKNGVKKNISVTKIYLIGDCKREGSSWPYLDEWGAANLGSNKNEGVCLGRAKAIWEYCTNSQQQPVRATFTSSGKSVTYPDRGEINVNLHY